jgi:3-deoxy-D-arabino-heptulosonate 7-phosphate (DAHP) synthase
MVNRSTDDRSSTVFPNVNPEEDEAEDKRMWIRREGDATIWQTFGRKSSWISLRGGTVHPS